MKHIIFLSLFISLTAVAKGTQSGSKPGRFQVVQISEMRRDQYLLDTETGQLWKHVCVKDEICAWVKDVVEDVNAKHDNVFHMLSAAEALSSDRTPSSDSSQ